MPPGNPALTIASKAAEITPITDSEPASPIFPPASDSAL